jgi:hypothetical protein
MSEEQVSEVQEETITNPADQAAPAGAGPELTVNDLNLLKGIIDVATQRGAFKPNEMVTIGTVYNKLETFLGAVAEQQKQGE